MNIPDDMSDRDMEEEPPDLLKDSRMSITSMYKRLFNPDDQELADILAYRQILANRFREKIREVASVGSICLIVKSCGSSLERNFTELGLIAGK